MLSPHGEEGLVKKKIQGTIYACYTGYIVQAIINNFIPLLFITFQNSYGISLSKITLLISLNFMTQLVVDMLAPLFVDKIGYRASAVAAHGFAGAGLFLLTLLPDLLADPFTGLVIAVMVYAIGGGLLEVLISPIVEALPTDNKEKAMSLLHSFYCWGHVAVVLLSTVFFAFFGTDNWKILGLLWAIVPLANIIAFLRVPIYPLLDHGEKGFSLLQMVKMPLFWLFMALMMCAGASEQSVSQWASTFAEQGLKVSKTIGDLAGPMFFAILMGTSRALYGKFGHKMKLNRVMMVSTLLCVVSYLIIALSPVPWLSLVACGICGFSVGIMWPGTFSIAASMMRRGGTLLFALLALAGDLGCASGPALVGLVSDIGGGDLHKGILVAIVFPLALIVGLSVIQKVRHKPLVND
ncbi:MAG: MFS transporter [Clostridiales bacterium]|nr:MFS transporter [Clostridiales bacterium]